MVKVLRCGLHTLARRAGLEFWIRSPIFARECVCRSVGRTRKEFVENLGSFLLD